MKIFERKLRETPSAAEGQGMVEYLGAVLMVAAIIVAMLNPTNVALVTTLFNSVMDSVEDQLLSGDGGSSSSAPPSSAAPSSSSSSPSSSAPSASSSSSPTPSPSSSAPSASSSSSPTPSPSSSAPPASSSVATTPSGFYGAMHLEDTPGLLARNGTPVVQVAQDDTSFYLFVKDVTV